MPHSSAVPSGVVWDLPRTATSRSPGSSTATRSRPRISRLLDRRCAPPRRGLNGSSRFGWPPRHPLGIAARGCAILSGAEIRVGAEIRATVQPIPAGLVCAAAHRCENWPRLRVTVKPATSWMTLLRAHVGEAAVAEHVAVLLICVTTTRSRAIYQISVLRQPHDGGRAGRGNRARPRGRQ